MLNLQIKKNKYIISKVKYDKFDINILKKKNSIFNITFEKDCVSCITEEKVYNSTSATKWFVFKINGKLNFELSGVLTSYINPLSDNNISVLVISSFDTDYIFIDEKNIDKALLIFKNKNIVVTKEKN
jgi:hypothetical protein